MTITGHPAEYMPGWNVGKTLTGHGLQVTEAQGEDVEALYAAVRNSVVWDGPTAVIAKRPMAPGIEGAEGTSHGHDALAVPKAIAYFEKKGNAKAVEALKADTKTKDPHGEYLGCGDKAAMRGQVGQSICDMIGKLGDSRKDKVMVIDSDLGGSTAMTKVQAAYPDIYVQSGVMERGNFSVSVPAHRFLILVCPPSHVEALCSAGAERVSSVPRRRLASGWRRASRGSSRPSLRSSRCASPRSRWRG